MTEVTPVPKKGKPPRKAKQVPQSVRDEVRARSGGRCEYDPPVDPFGRGRCPAIATEMHHRRRRSQGGKDEASNLVHLCHYCHAIRVHENPAEAYAAGYLTRGN